MKVKIPTLNLLQSQLIKDIRSLARFCSDLFQSQFACVHDFIYALHSRFIVNV